MLKSGPFQVAFDVFFLYGVAFVVVVLTLGQGDVKLGQTFFVHKKERGNDRESLFVYFALELFQFAAGEQQLAVALGLVVVNGAFGVNGDVHVSYKQFVAFKCTESLGDAGLALPDGFDFRAGKLQARRKFLHKKILI